MEVFSTAPSQIGFVHCSYYHIDEDGQHIKGAYIVAPRRRNDLLHDLLLEGNIVSGSGSAVVARRDLLERVGGFDETLTFAEDWDLWLRLAETAELDFVPDALVGIRLHDKSTQRGDRSQNEERFLRQRLLILDRWYQAPRFPPYACDEYRRMVADVAIQKIKARGPPWLSGEEELYQSIKFGASRFGRDLFSSRFDFLAEIYGPVPLARRLLTKVAKMGLSPAQYGALKGVVRSRRRMKVG
jgi:Glycosyltransferase like family 2